MLGWIGFNSYLIHCIIGTEPNERKDPQDLLIDLKVQLDLSKVVVSGRLEDTIDYRSLAAVCKNLAEEGQYELIEKYAADVISKLFSIFPIKSVWIAVKKIKGLSEADYALVELSESRL